LVRVLSSSTAFTLKAVPPYNFSLTIHKPAGWSMLTPYEIFEDDVLWTAIRWLSHSLLGLKLSSLGTIEKPEIKCEIFSSRKLKAGEPEELSRDVAWMLRVGEDIRDFYSLANSDPLVRLLIKDLYGMRRTSRLDIFPMLILAVTLQMAPITRSNQMMNLLIERYGEKILFDGREIQYWPSPKRVAETSASELQEKCKLGYRAKNLRWIAEIIDSGFPTPQELDSLSPEDTKVKLMELKGIGEYSADIASPHFGFALDVWSAKIFALIFGEKVESPRSIIPKLRKMAEDRWGKWKGYVLTYVLNDLGNLSKKLEIDLS
jgi:DNA-3-methyladenine glycosylase II